MTHTPAPWWIAGKGTIRSGNKNDETGGWIARVLWRNREANAALIVRAVNNHDALVELAHQYASDLRHPPSSDSRERRLERIEAVLAKVCA